MMACSCLSKGATAGDILPAGEICVRARRTSPRAESGMITYVVTQDDDTVTVIREKITVSFRDDNSHFLED